MRAALLAALLLSGSWAVFALGRWRGTVEALHAQQAAIDALLLERAELRRTVSGCALRQDDSATIARMSEMLRSCGRPVGTSPR